MTARERVLAKYPKAYATFCDFCEGWHIYKGDGRFILSDTEAAAWTIMANRSGVNGMNEQTEVSKAMEVLSKALANDEEYAWSWHCNVAMAAVDAGADRIKANAHAAQFLKNAFGINMRENSIYKNWLVDAASRLEDKEGRR